jgi:cytochrome c
VAEASRVDLASFFVVPNTVPELMGGAFVQCTATGQQVVTSATCTVRPPPPPPITDPQQLFVAKNCAACHGLTLAAPVLLSVQTIADFYRGRSPSVEALASKVVRGGAGTFGPLPMPANSQVSEAEAATLVRWMLDR